MIFKLKHEREALWRQLASENFVSGEMPVDDDIESPWYVRLLVGFAGWLAAGFMLGFIAAAFEFVFRNESAAIFVGGVMIFLAYLLLDKKQSNDFACQFALAVSFAGQVLTVYGLFDISSDSISWLIIAILQAVLAGIMPNSIHRVWSAFAAATALSFAFAYWHIHYIQTALIMLAVAYIWLYEIKWIEYHKKLKPIGYGLTLALLYQASTGLFHQHLMRIVSVYKDSLVQPWVGEVLTGVVMLFVIWQLLKRQHIQIPGRIANAAFVGILVLVAASFEAYGITVGVMIILLGYANGNRILTGMGIASLLFYISSYYYLLHITLLAKSQLLATLGVLLLLASWLMHRWLFQDKEIEHA